MARPKIAPGLRTATVSVCVDYDEAELIRNAAASAGLPVSGWGATRLAMAMTNAQSRNAVNLAAQKLALTRKVRRERVSTVIRETERDLLRKHAEVLELSAHAFMQACLIAAAERELGALPVPQLRLVEAARRDEKRAGSFLASVPRSVAELDAEALSDLVRALVTGVVPQIMGGNGHKIADGVGRLADAHENDSLVTIKLYVSEFEMRAVAFVLGVQPATLALALAVKAARRLRETAS